MRIAVCDDQAEVLTVVERMLFAKGVNRKLNLFRRKKKYGHLDISKMRYFSILNCLRQN